MLLPMPTSIRVAAVDIKAVGKHVPVLAGDFPDSSKSSKCQPITSISTISNSSTGTVFHISQRQRSVSNEQNSSLNSVSQLITLLSAERVVASSNCELRLSREPNIRTKTILPRNRRLINAIKSIFSKRDR